MKIILWILASVGALVVLAICLFVFLWIRSIRKSMKRDKELDLKIEPVIDAISQGGEVNEAMVHGLAVNPLTRSHLLGKMIELGRGDMFPIEYRTQEKVAESDLVRWLYHPNEMGAVPSEIEVVFQHEVVEDGRLGRCYLFRFRIDESHWAADRGWMCGLSGPFWNDDRDQCHGSSTFSEMSPYSDQSNEGHLAFLAEASTRFGWVMPNPLKG